MSRSFVVTAIQGSWTSWSTQRTTAVVEAPEFAVRPPEIGDPT